MTTAGGPRDRRWFLRSVAGAALGMVTMGAQALFGASPASAATTCCALVHPHNLWCPLTCAELGYDIYCWTCWLGRCKCCECSNTPTCWGRAYCSYELGCCSG